MHSIPVFSIINTFIIVTHNIPNKHIYFIDMLSLLTFRFYYLNLLEVIIFKLGVKF